MTPFPAILLSAISNPIDHIQQGDNYGDDLLLAYKVHEANEKNLSRYVKACDKGHRIDVESYIRREAIRKKAADEVAKLTNRE